MLKIFRPTKNYRETRQETSTCLEWKSDSNNNNTGDFDIHDRNFED